MGQDADGRGLSHGWAWLPMAALLAIGLPACKPATPGDGNAAGENSALAASGDAGAAEPVIPLVVTRADGGMARFSVEVARTEAEQDKGLSGRPALSRDKGMLFPFTPPRTASFWMKDTLVPLDLLFIRPDGTVAAILHGKPHDHTPLSAGEPVLAVVELAGGVAAAQNLSAGDRLRWGDCRPDARPAPIALRFCPG